MEETECPVNIVSIGGEQHLMSRQQPGMSQPRPNQQQGYNDMQSCQQHSMHKQIQEIHRQRQLQQQDLGGRQLNSPSQLSDNARQAGIGQLPPVLNGMPVSSASNYAWSREIMGGEPKTTNSSLMFHAGNMNSAHCSGSPMHGISSGLMFSHDQGQTIHPMGFVQQHGDQSLYGTPVSSTRYSSYLYPQPEGISHSFSDVTNKAGGHPLEKGSMQPSMSNYFQNNQSIVPEHGCVQEGISVANQGFQGNNFFGNAHMQDLNSGAMLGNLQQVNHFSHGAQVQEYLQDRDSCSGKSQGEKTAQVGPSRDVSNLDPTEEKLLFGTGIDGNWDGSFGEVTKTGAGGYHHVNSVQSNDHFGELPSIQSGSWSALMLDALEASSSDTGLQEEWSGLNSHKTEPSTRNHCALLNGNEKQQKSWDENNLQSASSLTSRSLPLFNDADASRPSFRQSTKFVYQQNETVPGDGSGESSQQSSKEANYKQLDQGHQQKQFVGYNIQEPTYFDNVANSVWAGQMCGPSVSTRHSADMEYNTQNMQMAWDHQQKMPMRDEMSSDKSNGSNINQSPSGDNTSNIFDNDAAGHAHRKVIKEAMHMERDRDDNAWEVGRNQVATFFPKPAGRQESVKSDICIPKMRSGDSNMGNFATASDSTASKVHQQVKQQLPYQNQMDYREHFMVGSSQNYKRSQNGARYQNQLSRNQQVRDSSVYNPEKNQVGERFDHVQESSNPRDSPDGGCIHSHPTQHNDSDGDGGQQENSMLTGNNSGPLISSRQKSSGQSGRQSMGSRRFQHHPMGNLEMDVEPEGSRINTKYPQGPNRLVAEGLKNQEQGHNGRSEFAAPVPPNSMDLGKEHLTDLQRIAKAGEEAQPSSTLPRHDSALSSFDGSAINISQNRQISQTSHNMLELLHKVDQSRINNTVTNFRLSDNNEPSDIPNCTSDGSACLQQDHSSGSHGFGLKLAPPSQWQPVLDNGLSSQASSQNANNFGTRNVDSGGGNKDSQNNVNSDNRANIYGQTNNQISYFGIPGNSSTLPYTRDRPTLQQQQWRQQHQHVSRITGSPPMDQSANNGSQNNKDAHARPCSNPRSSNDGNVSDQPAQGSISSVTSRTSKPNPAWDLPASLHVHSPNLGPSRPINSSSRLRSSGQQLPFQEMRSAVQPSTITGMSQQGGFSSMLQKVWSGLSAQQRLSIIQAHKIIPKPSHSTGPLLNSMDTNSWTPHKADEPNKESGNVPPELGTCSTKSQKFVNAEEYLVKGQSSQYMPLKKMDGSLNTGNRSQGQEPVSIPSLARLYPQELNRRKHAHDTFLDSQKENVSVPNADTQKQSYSLLQQAQAMKGSDFDPSQRAGKRLRAVSGADSPQMEWVAGQRSIYGHNTVFRELGAASQHSSFPSDIKMLSFSRENEDEKVNTSSELINREEPSEDLLNARQNNLQNQSHSLTLKRGNECPLINSQMASTWFDQYRPSYKNGQVIVTYDGPDNCQRNTKDNVQSYFFAKVSERTDNGNVMEQRDDTTQIGGLPQRRLSTALAANEKSSCHSLPSSATDNIVVLMPKKRKTATSDLLPWHKEVTQGSRRLLSISIAKQDWARGANRLIEKVENELEMVGNVSSLTPAQRRLILTTQLMQQLLPSIPATFLRADATISYESVTFFVSKLALGDASSLISCPRIGSLFHSNSGDMISEKLDFSENIRDHFLLKMMEDFVGRTNKLESDLLRLERRASLLDIRVECHDIDRCSVINRFAKFHGRAQSNDGESSSTPQIGPRHTFAQRHVTAHTVTTNLPEGRCLSL